MKKVRQVTALVLAAAFTLSGCGSGKPKYALIDPPTKEESSKTASSVSDVVKEVKRIVEEPFKTEERLDATIQKGEKKVAQKGMPGKSEITFRVTYRDGREIHRVAESERIISRPVNEIVLIGTKASEDSWNVADNESDRETIVVVPTDSEEETPTDKSSEPKAPPAESSSSRPKESSSQEKPPASSEPTESSQSSSSEDSSSSAPDQPSEPEKPGDSSSSSSASESSEEPPEESDSEEPGDGGSEDEPSEPEPEPHPAPEPEPSPQP